MIYLFQVTVYSALLYAVYILILKNQASHDWNRLYLLLCAFLPLVIPFIRVPSLYNSIPVNTSSLIVLLPEVNVFQKNSTTVSPGTSWSTVITAIYALISIGMLCGMTIQYIMFKRFVKRSKLEIVNDVKVLLDTETGPGSFQNYIFLPGDNIDAAIFEHELAHIRLKHSLDILFIRLLQILFWPNIVLYVIFKELKIVHEFQADAYAVKNKESYISTLLNDTFQTNHFALSHTFFYHPLKRRIMMLQKPPVSRTKLRMAILKASLLTTVLLTGVVYIQNCTAQTQNPKQDAGQPKMIVYDTVIISKMPGQGEILNYADVMPHAGYNLGDFLAKNLNYPEQARKMGIEGRVIVKFIVDEYGNVINPVIIRGRDSSLDAEALRAVKQLPPWTPGKQNGVNVAVYFTLPIVFSLGGDKASSTVSGEVRVIPNPTSGSFTIQGSTGKKNSEDVSIEVTDIKGNVVYNQKTTAPNGILNVKVQINTTAPDGMYIVTVQSTSLNKVLHVLIQR